MRRSTILIVDDDPLLRADTMSRHWPHIGVVVTSGALKPSRDLPARQGLGRKWARADQVVAAIQEFVEAA